MSTGDSETKAKGLRESAQKFLSLDYFEALGVTRTATPDEVKKAFLDAATTWHPDRVPSELDELRPLFSKAFTRLELARATVIDPSRRARYIDELTKLPVASASDVSSAEATLEFRKAEGLLKKNDTVQAEVHLRRAVQVAPSNVEYQVLLVWVQAKPSSTPERIGELIADLDRLLVRDDQSARAYFYRGQLKKRLDLVDEAIRDFARAAELNPANVDAVREVRIYKMRKERAESSKVEPAPESDRGVGGFFRKLFNR